MQDDSPHISPKNSALKPIDMKVSKTKTASKFNPGDPNLIEGFDLPEKQRQTIGFHTEKKHNMSFEDNTYENYMWDQAQQSQTSLQTGLHKTQSKFRKTRGKLKRGQTNESNSVYNNPMETPYTKPWDISRTEKFYTGQVNENQQPQILMDHTDFNKRLKFEHLKKVRLESMCNWKQKDTKGHKKSSYIKQIQRRNNQILRITEKTELEKLEVYTDRFPLLQFRKALNKMYLFIKLLCFNIINTSLFDNISISVILLNSVIMAVDDSASNDNPNPIFEVFESWFQILYTIEMIFKILGLGFVFGPDSYLHDPWNILDFTIVMIGWISILIEPEQVVEVDQPGPQVESSELNVSSLRTFRVLRPLKTISSIKGLKVLIVAVLSALPMLKDTILILMFFFIIFSIACTQMFNGKLKNRCFSLQTGQVHDDDMFCNNEDPLGCPGGYYCAKGSENPNYGVTNFDNLLYSFLTIFQFVTLEGWSEIQRDIQITVYKQIWVLFMGIVLSGAFFLLNLTLAVINSKFTESQNKQMEKDRIEMRESNSTGGGSKDDKDYDGPIKEEMSISQYITARIYAKKMIEFLRMRQTIKQIEEERQNRAKLKQKEEMMKRRNIRGSTPMVSLKNLAIKNKESKDQIDTNDENFNQVNVLIMDQNEEMSKSLNNIANTSSNQLLQNNSLDPMTIENNVIEEEDDNELSDQEPANQLEREIQDFMVKSKIQMQRQGVNTKDFRVPKKIDTSTKKDKMNVTAPNFYSSIDGGPTMKGNIEPVKKGYWNPQITNGFNKKLAEEFDIDNVIPKDDQKDKASDVLEQDSMASFQLSLNKLDNDIKNLQAPSEEYDKHHGVFYGNPQSQTIADGFYDINIIPGLDHHDQGGADSGLITSDSDFDAAAGVAVKQPQVNVSSSITIPGQYQAPKSAIDVRKDVTKAFKRMLTISNNRTSQENQKATDYDSTKYAGSQVNQDLSAQEVSFNDDIESKFKKRKSRYPIMSKNYKEDEVDDHYLCDMFDQRDQTDTKKTGMSSFNKYEIRQLEEFVVVQKPLDPFRDLNPLTHKVEISKDQIYQGTSQQDVFLPRKVEQDLNMIANKNVFIKRPGGINEEFNEKPFIKNIWDPYQMKTEYRIEIQSSDEDESLNEDEIQAQEQPFITPMRIGFYHQTKQIKTQEAAKRSDIMITSTLSLSLYPKDQRKIKDHYRIEMSRKQIREYIDEKNAFKAMVKEHSYQVSKIREKDKELRENYIKSFLHRAEFESKTLKKFKTQVIMLNKTKLPNQKKSKEQIKQENQKYQQNKRASEKRGLPSFDMEHARKLLEGKFHEEDEDEAEKTSKMLNNKAFTAQSQQELDHQSRVDKFEMQLQQILDQNDDDENHLVEDEVPYEVRKTFHVPRNLGDNVIDYQEIRKFDASHKKSKPVWSGQDVLKDGLDNLKSAWAVNAINKHRVWPVGLHGLYKRIRFVIRLIVKAEAYDHFFTFFVFLNTITLSLNSYGMSEELETFLESTNIYFTVIFIVEMFAKIAGIGVKKYCADKMNYLDGFIVLASIFEMVYTKIVSQGGSVQGLSLLRLLRTFRVVRIVRLLRGLESIQTIVSVMTRSYMSFVYITGLMFLFMFIFTLTGMQLFGGYWKNDPEGLPDNHYDSFGYAVFTVFQVLTMENWQSVLFVMNRQNSKVLDPVLSALFLMVWIIVGNFILLNLFLAILLDAFLVDDDDLDEEEIHMLKMKKIQKKLEKKRRKEEKLVKMDTTEIKKMNAVPELSKFYFGQEKTQEEEDLEDLDEDQIVQIFKEQGFIKKNQDEMKEQKLFVGIECKQSFYVFSKDNYFRILCYKLIKHPQWENVVLFLISASSFKLVYDTFYIEAPKDDIRSIISGHVDSAFNYIFIVEMLTKLISLGLVMDEGSYLRDEWNKMDFFIVMSSIFDMALDGQDLAVLKILRMLRTLRPLRFLTHNVGLKLIVNALIGSISGITNVLLVVAVVYLIFAILFVNFYAGKFFYCSIDTYVLHTEQECLFAGGSWELYDHNFDSAIPNGWITLFIVASLEGWPDILIQAVQSTDIDLGPALGNSNTKALTFFIIFIFVGSFFFLNFFIGVLFMKFNKAQEEEQKGYTDKDLAWMDIQRLILSAEPDYESTNVPKSNWRKKFHDLVSTQRFDAVIMSIIILNMIQMGLLTDQMDDFMIGFINITNTIFAIIFIIEAILKLIAFGRSYFNNNWNRFDFFVVGASIFDFVLEMDIFTRSGGSNPVFKVLPKIARVMRVLRVTRILRLAGKAKSLQAILSTITFSIPALANVFILLMLIYFMMAVLVNFQFNDILEGDAIDPDYKNFRDFQNSIVLLFALSTGEDWNKVMFDCSREPKDGCVEGVNCGNRAFATGFFIMLVLVCSYVMLNLFILVIIQQFEKYYLPEVNILGEFKADIISFMKIWKELTQNRYDCLKIKENQISSFFRKLGNENDSLGFSDEHFDDGELKKNILKMAIKSDQGYIFFNEMLYRCMRRKYGNMKINKKMQIFELRTQYSIYIMTLKIQDKSKQNMTNDDIFNSIIKKENGVNPFLTVMNFKISFKTWLNVAREEMEGSNVFKMSNPNDKKTCKVEVELEEFHEYTSDEIDDLGQSMYGKSVAFSQIDQLSGSRSQESIKKKGKSDSHLKFEKAMRMKLKSHKLLSQINDKNQLGSNNNTPLRSGRSSGLPSANTENQGRKTVDAVTKQNKNNQIKVEMVNN